jgi:hypothetical protein
MKVDLLNLNLGSDSAEKDILVGLSEYFYRNSAYQNILNNRKTILVGNRGSGKSAIFKYIAAEESRKGNLVLELSPEEYSYDILSQHMKQESEGSWGKQSSYSIAWQYLIYNLIFKKIVDSKRGLATGSMKNIYTYVRDNLKTQNINPIGILISYLKRLEGIKIGDHEARIWKTRELSSLYSLEEIQALVPSLQKVLEAIKIKIFVDELDKGWDNSEDAQYFIAGLFQASQKINTIHPNLKVYVSIRQELFENIPQIYDDAQKIREEIEVIRWDQEELLEFIGLRILHSVPKAERLRPKERWQLLFRSSMNREVATFDYLIHRTHLRPREFLQFCKLCVENSAGERVCDESIMKAEAYYSEQKTKDLAAEYRFQYPGLLDLLESFRGGKAIYQSQELDELLLAIVCGDIRIGDATWALTIDDDALKRILWQIGFLKAWAKGGKNTDRKNRSTYLGFYESPKLNLDQVVRFQVHPACHSYLSLHQPPAPTASLIPLSVPKAQHLG